MSESWLKSVAERTNHKLADYFSAKFEETKGISVDSAELVAGVESLTMRGGKRLRPIVAAAAYDAVCETPNDAGLDAIGASLELLQSYLLIHDDFMDQDRERRGGPAVHVIYEDKYDEHLAASIAILAGDLGSAYAWELLLEAGYPSHRQADALEAFLQIHKEVLMGQHLDLTANANVSLMHHLKTTSYTVNGPIRLGAILGDGSDEQIKALTTYGNPIGEAFQLRDDVLGTFGGNTGKPGDDIINGKRNGVILEAEKLLSKDELAPLYAVFGQKDAAEADVAKAAELLTSCGARKNVETQLMSLLDQAKASLFDAPLREEGKAKLGLVADKLAVRKY